MSKEAEVKKIVEESGNNFHSKVYNYLKKKDWHTLVSPYYMDSTTDKPREIDLISEKAWQCKFGDIIIRLFIECKYITQPNVFWFSEKDFASAKKWVISNTPFKEGNFLTDKHHYLASDSKVAKLFNSKKGQNIESEVIYKALNQSLNAMVYRRGRQPINPKVQKPIREVIGIIEMPVILCSSFTDFFRVEMEDPAVQKIIDTNFLLEVNYAYLDHDKSHRMEYFLIDVVDFENIDDFLNALDEDCKTICQLFI